MARTSTPPEKDPKYAPRRDEDSALYWVELIARILIWPLTVTFLTLAIGLVGIRLVYGEAVALEVLAFMRGPMAVGIIALLGSLLTAATTVALRRIPQVSRFERRQAATQAGVEQTREDVLALVGEAMKEVRAAVKAQPAGGDRVDPTPSEVLRIVMGLQKTVDQIQANAAAAAANSTSALETVVHYGENLQAIASMAATTGDLKARTDAAGQSARDSLRATQPTSAGEPFPAPPPRHPKPAADPLDTSRPWYRDPTSQQAAVPAADEQEDYRPGDEADDGPGLPTGYRMDFRAAMEAADRDAANPFLDERLLRGETQPTQPAPRFPRPDADERARQADARRQMRDRQRTWDNPEEGPR